MKNPVGRKCALFFLVAVSVGACGSPPEAQPDGEGSTRNLSDVRVQWTSEPGINLKEGVAVPVLALAEPQRYLPGDEFILREGRTDSEYQEFDNHVTSYLPRVGDPAITGGMTDEYWRTYSRLIANAELPQ